MAANGEERGGPKGVAVQMHAYICSPPAKPDNSALRVKDGKQIEVANGSTGETLGLQVDHAYQQATEEDVMERSLRPLVAACVEGVNVSVLAVGSAKTQKSRVLFSPMPEQSVAAAVFRSLLDTLQRKASTLSSSGASHAAANGGISSARKNHVVSSANFSLRVSFAELYEETITDLVAANSDARPALSIEDDPALGKTIKNLTQSPPLTSLSDFRRVLDTGIHGRRSTNGLYGNSSEFSSAVLRISVKQTFAFKDAPAQELHSLFDLVDLPATDRLTRAGSAVRLSEGPLLNKSLFALQEVVESLTHNGGDEVPARYQGSQLTTLLQDALGGNCLTFVLMCLSPGDMTGSAATLQLGRMLPRISTFPVVNNDMLRGLRRRQFMVQKQVASTPSALVAAKDGKSTGEKQNVADYERRLHDLEGRLAQNALERRVLREDKDAVTAQLGELRAKYRELFDNELSLRTELLACEQEKLALSKAFVAFQLERDTQVQQLDSDKFEVETRLLKAEQLVVEIQQDDATKAAQIQNLCAKMNELVADKTRLGGELALLQKAVQAAESARDAEAKKNQQLSLELIVAVNQKQKCQGETEALAAQLRARQAQVDAQLKECTQLRSDNEALRQSAAGFEEKLEAMRKDVVRRELELERAELAAKKEQLETQQARRDADSKREYSVKQLSDELETQRAAFAADKRSLELQLERVQQDLAQETREKQHAMVLLKAKHEENEELLLTLERARHDAHAQLDTFRLKIALLQQSSNNGDRASESGSGAGLQALRELLASYQVRERELRDELSSARSANMRLARRLRDPAQDATESLQSNENEKDGAQEDGVEPTEGGELERLRERLAAAEQQVASEMEQRTDQALVLTELEARNAALVAEHKAQQAAPAQDNESGVRAITEMHAALARQLEEVRRLTLQQQQQNTAAPPPSQPQTSANRSSESNELESLRAAKAQLESRLSSSKAQWMALLEQVERRCAELLTKNVMLAEDNENLRLHLTQARMKAPR